MDTAEQLNRKKYPIAHRAHPGLDLFKISGQTISGFLPSFKTGNKSHIRQPFTTLLEERLALFLEYHPQVLSYQRGDISANFAAAYEISLSLSSPYNIYYAYEGESHVYLPDFIGTMTDGTFFIAEAGLHHEKSKDQAQAKAEAAQALLRVKNGIYWMGTEKNLPVLRHHNFLYLHARRQSFSTYQQISQSVMAHWPYGEMRSVHDFIQLFGSHWSEQEVEAAVWKIIGDAAAAGRFVFDLANDPLSRFSKLALLSPDDHVLIPPPLSCSPDIFVELEEQDHPVSDETPLSADENSLLPGPTFDASILKTEKERKLFYRNLHAVTTRLSGQSLKQVGHTYGISPATLSRLVQRTQEIGQLACVPYGSYLRGRKLLPEFQALIRKLYTRPKRPSVMEIYEDVRLKRLAVELSQRESSLIKTPTYRQIWYFIHALSKELKVTLARSGMKHPQRERMSPSSYVLSIPAPALVCQVDEHTFDQFIVTAEGSVLTRRVHAAALICVKTAAILGFVFSLDTLNEEDYMRLIKQTLEPKDKLVALYECQNPWPCYGKPAVIFHDRGKIFTSERARQVLVDRLGIITEQAPPYAPSAKGTVEALFTWTTRKFEHRMPGTAKSSPQKRGNYDSIHEAKKAGITLEVLEKLFTQAIVDGYMQEWDTLRRQVRFALWEEAVREKGLPRWLGSQDDLKLLLMKAVNRKNASHRYVLHSNNTLAFLGHRYVSPGLLNRLRGKEIDIRYDRRDIAVIYLFVEGEFVGEAYCIELQGKRTSIWEAAAMKKQDRLQAQEAQIKSLENRQRIEAHAHKGKRELRKEQKRIEKMRQLDMQRGDIHPSHVQHTLAALTHISSSPVGAKRSPVIAPAIPDDTPRQRNRLSIRKR